MVPALVLAAGLGTRLDPLTRLVAKPAVPLGERTLIERLLEHLQREGVRDVVLNLHYKPETITAVVGDGRQLGLRVRYSWEREILGSAGGPRRALSLVDSDTFLLVNGDTLCEFPLGPMLEAHEHSSADVTLAVVRNPSPQHYNGIRAGDDDVVRGFEPKGAAAGTWHFVGVQVTSATVFGALPDGVPAETISGLYRGFVATQPGRVCVYPVTSPLIVVGTPRDYFAAARRFVGTGGHGAADSDSVRWPGVQVAPGARLTRCIVATDVADPLTATDAVLVPSQVARADERVTRHGSVAIFPFESLP
ncbi:MAG TPA: nucleotidyltransferase family protein [Vicinamibacterales bacterium]